MEVKSVISVALIAVFMVVMFVGCSDSANAPEKPESVETSTEVTQNTEQPEAPVKGNVSVEKLWNIKLDVEDDSDWNFHADSIYYEKSDMHGIMSLDGKFDTGAVYTYLKRSYYKNAAYPYYIVSKKKAGDDIEALNIKGLVDTSGKEIIPQKYADIDVLSEKYANAYELVEAVTQIGNKKYYLTVDETTYITNVHTYDLTTGEIVWTNKCVSDEYGNTDYVDDAFGDYLAFQSSGHFEKVDGTVLPEGALLFKNGSYAFEGVVYNTNDKKLFAYDEDDYVPVEMLEEYYLSSKTEGENTSYVLVDKVGKKVTSVLSGRPAIYGDLLFVNGQLYDFVGNKIIDGKFDGVYYESNIGDYWVLINTLTDYDTKYTYIDREGNMIYECMVGKDSDILVAKLCPFVIYKSSEKKVFCFADKDFTISATPYILDGENGQKIILEGWDIYVENTNETINIFTGDVLVKGEFFRRHHYNDKVYYFVRENNGTISVYRLNNDK